MSTNPLDAAIPIGTAVLGRRRFLIGAAALSAALALDGVGCIPAASPATQTYLSPGPLADHPEDNCYLFRPGNARSSSPVVFYLHGCGKQIADAMNDTPAVVTFLTSLADQGYTVLAADFGDPDATDYTRSTSTFGNHYVTARIEEYRQWLLTRPALAPNVDASTVGVLGASMGAANALAYARDYRAVVAVAGTVIPFTDIAWTRADRDDPVWVANSLLASLCDGAWQLLDTDPTPPDADLTTVEALVGLPWRGYYRSDDAVINPARLDVMQQWIGPSAAVIDVGTTGGHDPDIWADVPFSDFTTWFSSYLPVPAT